MQLPPNEEREANGDDAEVRHESEVLFLYCLNSKRIRSVC